MSSNFPLKFFLLFANSPKEIVHKNNINAGLRLGLTLLMEEYEVHVLLTEEAIWLATKQEFQGEQQTLDKFSKKAQDDASDEEEDDLSFTTLELIEGLISFGGHIMTCKSSLTLTGLKAEDIIEGVEIIHLHHAVKVMIECDKVLVF